MTNAAIERRQGDTLSEILGTGDTRAALERLERNARDVIELARERGYVKNFGGSNEHFGMPAWALLGLTYNLYTDIIDVVPIDGGYRAQARVKHRDSDFKSDAYASCTRKEPNWRNKQDPDIMAMAQTRARRNALRGVLSPFLVLTGFDFSDPDAPATNDQVAVLHILEREIGWDHDQGHVEAGDVTSYRDLTREQASEVIERWTALHDEVSERGRSSPSASDGEATKEPGDKTGEPGPPVASPIQTSGERTPDMESGEPTDNARGMGKAKSRSDSSPDSAPATTEQWERAALHGLTGKKAVAFGKTLGINVGSASELTQEQLQRIFAKWLDRK